MALFVPCPHCGTEIHPIASRCKACRGDVLRTPAPIVAPPTTDVAHTPHAPMWSAIAIGVVGVGALAAAAWWRSSGEPPLEQLPAPTPATVELAPIPPPPPPKPPDDPFATLVGRWKGTGDQPDVGMKWSVDLALDKLGPVGEPVGSVTFGGPLNCRGELSRGPDEGDLLVLHERVTENPDGTCVSQATIKIAKRGDDLDATWFYENGTQAATGRLSR